MQDLFDSLMISNWQVLLAYPEVMWYIEMDEPHSENQKT